MPPMQTTELILLCNWVKLMDRVCLSITGIWIITAIVKSQSELRDRVWSNARHVTCKNIQCCPVSSVQRHFPGKHGITWSCSQGTWCKPHDTMCLHRFFGPTTILGRSIHILCCCIMDDDTNLLHLFRDITKQILTVSLDQHWNIMPIFNVALNTSQYLYNDI